MKNSNDECKIQNKCDINKWKGRKKCLFDSVGYSNRCFATLPLPPHLPPLQMHSPLPGWGYPCTKPVWMTWRLSASSSLWHICKSDTIKESGRKWVTGKVKSVFWRTWCSEHTSALSTFIFFSPGTSVMLQPSIHSHVRTLCSVGAVP